MNPKRVNLFQDMTTTVINNKILAIFVIIIITLFGCNKSEKINYNFQEKICAIIVMEFL